MYEIKVLSNNEFDSLPESETRGSTIFDSLGFANKFTGKAYVRQTGIHDLNKYLVNHELEELEQESSHHEDENGIRHKKFFKEIFMPLFTGMNLETGKWSPAGILDPSITKTSVDAKKNASSQQDQQNQQMQQLFSSFGQQQQTSPMSQFSVPNQTASPRIPESAGGGQAAGSIFNQAGQNPGLDNINIPPDILARLKGNYAGRMTF